MNLKKLSALRQVKIETPCPENWDAMDGDDKKRFCSGCGCHVHNIEQFSATEAEALITSGDRVCTRMKVDVQKGILTRDGWVPRMLLAGAVAASMAGCNLDPQGNVTGEVTASSVQSQQSVELGEAASPQDYVAGTIAVPQSGRGDDILGKVAYPPKQPKPISKKPTTKKNTPAKKEPTKKQPTKGKSNSTKKKPRGK